MNIIRRFYALTQHWAVEILLVIFVVALVAQLFWPSIRHWWRLPASGRLGFDTCSVATLAAEFVIRLPQEYDERDQWPLVVFLHGSGDRGHDPSMMHDCGILRRRLYSIIVAPQCLPSISWEPDAIAALIQCVSHRYRVDRDRVYLVGYSMGGYGTWATAAAHPEIFAAIVPIAGGGNPALAKSLATIPIWAFHGKNDKTVPIDQTNRMVEAIRAAGGQPNVTILTNEGHGICENVWERDDLWQWLFQKSRSRIIPINNLRSEKSVSR
jgi:predicted peptidase